MADVTATATHLSGGKMNRRRHLTPTGRLEYSVNTAESEVVMKSEHAMYGAIARGDVAAVRELVATVPSVLEHRFLGKSWLHWASQVGQVDIMEVLVAAGQAIDQVTTEGDYTALKIAAGQGHLAACLWLLDHGADINHGLGTSPTPIFGAIFGRSLELVHLFVERGADLSATFSALKIDVVTYALRHGTPEIVELLRKPIDS